MFKTMQVTPASMLDMHLGLPQQTKEVSVQVHLSVSADVAFLS